MSLLDKIMVVNGESVELSPEIRERMEEVFNEAVQDRLEEAELNGIDCVLDTMKMHGMAGSAEIVERYLVADGVIIVSGDGENENEDDKQNEAWMSDIVKMIG